MTEPQIFFFYEMVMLLFPWGFGPAQGQQKDKLTITTRQEKKKKRKKQQQQQQRQENKQINKQKK